MQRTPKIQLSQFEGNDTPKWLQDYNGDMSKIDDAIIAVDTEATKLLNRVSKAEAAIVALEVNAAKLLDKVYPVGSIYESTVNVNPKTFIGGEWEPYGSGRVLVAHGTSDAIYNANDTGGSSRVTLSINEMPSHDHALLVHSGSVSGYPSMSAGGAWGNWDSIPVDNRGGGQSHDNMPPYIVVYRWRRKP